MLHLLNTAILPTGCEGRWDVTPMSLAAARALITRETWVSHIGHASTAALASALLGVEIPASREPWDGTGTALVVQLAFRGEEGRIYTAEEMTAFAEEGKIILRVLTWADQHQG